MTENVSAPFASDAPHEYAYRVLSGDDSDERSCTAIPEAACTARAANYLLNVANGAATKLAEQLASPGLVLPWLVTAVGAPGVVATLFTPIRQIGALLPQLAVAGAIRGIARRKWVWSAAGAIQAAALVLIATAALTLPALAAGIAILGLFALFCLASGAGSVAFQDVVGKTVPKGARGRMLANRALIGGLLALAAAALLRGAGNGEGPLAGGGPGGDGGLALTVGLTLAAAALWALGAVLFALMQEVPGATEGGRSTIAELRGGFGIARSVAGFRHFLLVRALLLAVELAMPVFVLQANASGVAAAADLPVYMFAVALAAVISSPFWGRLSDRASESVMALSGLIGAAAGIGIVALPLLAPDKVSAFSFAGFFVLLGIAEAGIRLGRKTYLVDGAPADERALYAAFSNTLIGVLAFAGFAFGVLADMVAPAASIGVIALLALAGAWSAWRLPPAEAMAAQGTT